MKKNTFFNFYKAFMFVFAEYTAMFLLSFFLVSLTQFNKVKDKIHFENLPVYHNDDISYFESYLENDSLFILIETNNKKEDMFFVDYALHYFEAYKKAIYLDANNVDNIIYVNISLDCVITIS